MKKFLSLVLALVMAMSLVTVSAGAKDFTDSDSISGEDYAEAIDVMSALQIIDGYEGGAFQPQGTLTRGAAAKIIACMMLGKTTAEALGNQAAPFKDVPVGSTFAGYIAYCVEAGIIDGYADGTFRPSNKLTGFAFLKMLLTAMGYDSKIEGFTGTNWTVNVARRAIENGLTKGNDNFVGTALATREEACLYAVNTIKATLVEYENKGSSIVINGVEISQGASSPKVVTSGNASQATSINSDKYTGTVSGASGTNYYTVEFGEKYMPKLSLRGTTDDFKRPTHTWSYDGVKVGTYTDEADLEYNKKVTSNEIYASLGLTSTVNAEIYVDGVNIKSNGDYTSKTYTTQSTDAVYFTVQKNNTDKTGDKGALTQVWKTGHWNNGVWVTDVLITIMHYYVGDVVSTTPAASNREAYATIVGRGENTANTVSANGRNGRFNTEDFKTDDVVVYNYSQAVNANSAVQNVTVAETATGTLSGYTTSDSATVGGTKYDYSCTIANQAANAAVNKDVTVVLDPFGYAIDIDGADDESYAVVLGINDENDLRTEANLLFADGTAKIVSTSANFWNTVSKGDVVTYEIKSNDRYALTLKADSFTNTIRITNGAYTFLVGGTYSGSAWSGTPTTYYANGDTIFLVKTVDANGNAMYNAYKGIKNVPTVTLTTANTVSVYCKNGANQPATVVYVDASNASVLNPTSDVIFLKGNNDGQSYTTGIGGYYKFDGTVNGELKDGDKAVKTSAKYDLNKGVYKLFDGVSYDANGVATLYISDNVIEGTGAYKQSNDVLGTQRKSDGGFGYYSVASGCYVVVVTEDDAEIITGLTAASVVQDTNDQVFFKLNSSNQIASAYIVKVPSGEIDGISYNVAASTGVEFSVYGGSYFTSLSKVPAGATVTVRAAKDATVTNASLSGESALAGGTVTGEYIYYTFKMPAANVAANTFVVTANTYSVTFDSIEAGLTGKFVGTDKTVTNGSLTATGLASGTYTVEWTGTGYMTKTTQVVVNGANVEHAAAPTYVAVTIDSTSQSTGANGVKITGVDYTHVVAGDTVQVTVDLTGFTGSGAKLKANSDVVQLVTGGAATQTFSVVVNAATQFSLEAI